MNVCEVYDLRKNMEYQCVAEDSKTRVYVSLVRKFCEEDYEKYRKSKKRKRIRKAVLIAGQALKLLTSVTITVAVCNYISTLLLLTRGSAEIGSEIIAAGFIFVAVYKVMDWIIGGEN